jgi:hypothetical protein
MVHSIWKELPLERGGSHYIAYLTTRDQSTAIKSDAGQVLTSLSILELLPRTAHGPSCTDVRYREPMDHQGWDQSTLNKSRAELL